jgi:hypothetical protein
MKYLIFTLSLFSFILNGFSQDSIKIRTEVDSFNKSNYEGQFDYVFARKEAKKQLFKLGAMPNGNHSYFELAYERKIAQDVSLNIALSNTNFGDFIENSGANFTNFLKIGIEPRWYYTMKKDIKNGLISDNLNGNYVGLRTNLNYTDNSNGQQGQSLNLISELTWGMQRRILRNQYLDFNLGTGLIHRFNKLNESGEPSNQNKWLFNYRFTYGIILDNNLFKKNKTQNCEALRCFEEEKNLWKVGLNKVLSVGLDGIGTNLSIANEHKISNSAFSIETKLNVFANKYKELSLGSESYGANLQVMPRYYWDLNKRIAKGESANNLSGKYVGLSLNYGIGQYKTTIGNSINNYRLPTASIVPVIGFQKRLLNHLFIDANVGYGIFYKKLVTGWDKKNDLSGNFTFGLSF